jgi:UDP-GlcNAc3NAcA epimerase
MPEEYSRVQTDRLSRWLFCPTPTAVKNLAKESLLHCATRKIVLCGDVMFDNIDFYGDRVDIGFVSEKTAGKNYALLTIHRNYNTDDLNRLIPLLQNITSLVKERGLIALIPLHPRLAKVAEGNREVSELLKSDWIVTTPPVSYGETISLIKMSQFVLTDSGGIQKEAAMLGKKVLVLRTETEWVEWVEAGFAFVVSNELDRMRQALKESKAVRQAPNILKQKAAPIILQTIKNDLS